ncbi:MAG: CHAT domain-containing protein [Roseomonas sp.]|nr:CHAT domain-containing protein [Roseomonas sp.]
MNRTGDHPSSGWQAMNENEAVEKYLKQHGPGFGGADILCVGHARPSRRVADVIHLLLHFKHPDGRFAVRGFQVVAPVGGEPSEQKSAILSELDAVVAASRGDSLGDDELRWLDSHLKVVIPATGETPSLLSVIEGAAPHSVVIVSSAAMYRAPSAYQVTPVPTAELRLHEDIWVPHLVGTARAATAIAGRCGCYILLDAGEYQPRRAELIKSLMSVDGCGVLTGLPAGSPAENVVPRLSSWLEALRAGRIGAVLTEIKALDGLDAAEKLLLRVQLLHRTGYHRFALAELGDPNVAQTGDPLAMVQVARLAVEVGATAIAAQLLGRCSSSVHGLEPLEGGLEAAYELHDTALADRFAERLAREFPNSARLSRWRADGHLLAGRYKEAARELQGHAEARELASFFDAIADRLEGCSPPDYPAILDWADRQGTSWAERARAMCAQNALDRHLPYHALRLAVPDPACALLAIPPHVALAVAEAILLLRTAEGRLIFPIDEVVPLVAGLIAHLSSTPSDQATRVRLLRLLSAPVSGDMGLAVVAVLTLQLASQTEVAVATKWSEHGGTGWLERGSKVLEPILRWLAEESPTVIGRTVLPMELLTVSADDLLAGVAKLIRFEAEQADGDNADNLLRWAAVASAAAPHATDPDEGYRLARFAAEGLATTGQGQRARDLVEGLIEGADTPSRMRLAWFAMADIYNRAGDRVEAMIAMACALSRPGSVGGEQAWLETTLLVRLLRDSGLHEMGLALVSSARQLFDNTDILTNNGHRLDLLELQLVQGSCRTDELPSEALANFIAKATVVAGSSGQQRDNAVPLAMLLGQLLREAGLRSLPRQAAAEAAFERLLARVGPLMAATVRAASRPAPTAAEAFALLSRARATRYAEDLGHDLRLATTIAKRLLGSREAHDDPVVAAFALELLSDVSVATPGWEIDPAPPPLPAHVGEPADLARALSTEGTAVVMSGFDATGGLVRICATDGVLNMQAGAAAGSITVEGLRRWAEKFPYAYGADNDLNIFYTSTESFVLHDLPPGPLIFVSDVGLQRFPPQLLRNGERFVGTDQPTAVIPSLSWLKAARSSMPRRETRSIAWISTAEGSNGDHTLAVMVDWLGETFQSFDVEIHTSNDLPDSMENVDLAIVAAHGSVIAEGSYFQRISDDALLRVPASRLARALRNGGVIVLFVCSGGRADPHPSAHTVVGLAKQLIDQGCSAVVGSPWPLDPRVSVRWLPEFLSRWSAGERLIHAVHEANLCVAKGFPHDPARSLAMTLYGDPFLTTTSKGPLVDLT